MPDPGPVVCRGEHRRQKVREQGRNGFDYLEVDLEQYTLTVYLLVKLEHAERLTERNFVIRGGRSIRDLRITGVEVHTPPDPHVDDCLVLTFDRPGDYSIYTLCIVDLDEDGRPTDRPYPGFDRRYACLTFTFAADCPSEMDCQQEESCVAEPRQEPEINYLAKDYASFRQRILDRLAMIMPDWRERHVPDLGIALVELLAYSGDYLSYYQDAVATEAYLDTARQRISVRRHARLVDYRMHEGGNARAWLCVTVDEPVVEIDPADTMFFTRLEGHPTVLSWFEDVEDITGDFETFAPLLPGEERSDVRYRVLRQNQQWIAEPDEPRATIVLRRAHNRLRFHAWGDSDCCLERGATSAWLVDDGARPRTDVDPKDPHGPGQIGAPQGPSGSASPPVGPDDFEWTVELKTGDFLILEEVLGPKTGLAADADPAHRHVVRVTAVERDVDLLYGIALLHVTWSADDALPFPLCISAPARPPDCKPLSDVSVACGNVILVDHGRPVPDEDLGCVPGTCVPGDCECDRPGDVTYRPGHFGPRLSRSPLVFSQPLPEEWAPASQLLAKDPRTGVPAVRVLGFPDPDCRPPETTPEAGTKERPPGKVGPAEPVAAAASGTRQVRADVQQTDEWQTLQAERWLPRYDLLDSDGRSRHFVVEVDSDGRAHLRFGDGDTGMRPASHSRFVATYRIGGGVAGNVGAETITHLVYRNRRPAGIRSVRNPLPASGGQNPEPLSDVKLYAPHAFRMRLERAVLADDYAAIVMRDFGHRVQQANAQLRWTGSGYEILVVVDPFGDTEPSAELLAGIENHLMRYRRIGHDVRVLPAHRVGVVVVMHVCVAPDFLRGHVRAALLDRFSSRRQRDGRPGFFHPDRLTPGQDIHLSELVTAALAVPGVLSATVTSLRRFADPHDATGAIPDEAVESGSLALGPLELARLDNDAAHPGNGWLALVMDGGR